MKRSGRIDWIHDLFLPTLLFAALGGMTWAVRGCSGYGASVGCIFAGVAWGAAWWFISREPGQEPSRRYTSGWIVLAFTVGIGLSGARGWMQWPSFFEGRLLTNAGKGEFLPIDRRYGFAWLFIAGVPWAGIGACLLAWCGAIRETRAWHWALRIGCAVGGVLIARFLFDNFPQWVLPLHESIEERYRDHEANPNLRRLINDNRQAVWHMGLYVGLLAYELGRRDWKNLGFGLTVGIVNGIGWALLQNWKWAAGVWEGANFNWWRCWESSGGISIGIALGVGYFLFNRRMGTAERNAVRARRSIEGPNAEWLIVYLLLSAFMGLLIGESADDLWFRHLFLAVFVGFGILYYALRGGAHAREPAAESNAYGDPSLERLGLYLGLLFGLGISIRSGLKGWFNIYHGNEDYWSGVLWNVLGPVYLSILIGLCVWTLKRPLPRDFRGDLYPHAVPLMWLVLLVQNALGLLVTGPWSEWNEAAFAIYYVLLFLTTAAIVMHYTVMQRQAATEVLDTRPLSR